MSRATVIFQEAFDELADALGQTPEQVAADAQLQRILLSCFNRAYNKGWTKRPWEDAWTGKTVVPTDGTTIDFSLLGDARRFEVWTADPRTVDSTAVKLRCVTGSDGIRLLSSQTSAFVLYMPLEVKFTTTAYVGATAYAAGARVLATNGKCYKSLQGGNAGHEPSASADWWEEEPLLQVLNEFTLAYARATYLIVHTGQPSTGAVARNDALEDLEMLAQTEHFRTAANLWKPTT